MRAALFRAIDVAIRIPSRLGGAGRHRDPLKHFGAGGVAEAEAECERINRDPAGYMLATATSPPAKVERMPLADCERILFDSPRPSGHPPNDRVELRLYGSASDGPPLLFHHPVYQASWNVWRWFLEPLTEFGPVAHMASPYHFGRTPPGWFPGEGAINPNPLCMFQAIRQWFADESAARRVLRQVCGSEPAAVVGYSLGAFQSILAGSFGQLRIPIVSIATTSRYGWGLVHGSLGRPVRRIQRRLGIDPERLLRMVRSLELDRHAEALRGHPVLFIQGRYDAVDPPPSIELLERAMRPTRTIRLEAAHASAAIYRCRIAREIRAFLDR